MNADIASNWNIKLHAAKHEDIEHKAMEVDNDDYDDDDENHDKGILNISKAIDENDNGDVGERKEKGLDDVSHSSSKTCKFGVHGVTATK